MNEDEMLRKLKDSAENEEILRKNKDSAEDEMLRKLTDSAEDTEIPSGLEPGNIRKNLEDNKEKIKKKSEEAKIYKFAKIASLVTAAAVVAFLIPMAVIISGNLKKNNTGAAAGAAGNTESGVTAGTVEGSAGQTAGSTGQADGSDIQAGQTAGTVSAGKTSLTSVFTPAGDYETIYNKLKDAANSGYYYGYGIAADTTDGTTAGAAVTENAAAAGNTAAAAASSEAKSQTASSTGDYSGTNLREQGVDEGDIVKTDGQYIYILDNTSGVRIVKADGATLSDIGSIKPELGSGSVLDMYVSGDRLILVIQQYSTSLESTDSDTYAVQNKASVSAQTYDISDRQNPALAGEIQADGYYETARLTGGVLYLMTTYAPENAVNPVLYRSYDVTTATADGSSGADSRNTDSAYDQTSFLASGAVPEVNGATLPAEDIYLPTNTTVENYLVLTSVRLTDPSVPIDSKAILSYSNNMYVSTDAIFLDATSWMGTDGTTIARIDFADGVFTPSGACTVPGIISDSFSMDEAADGTFRVASTVYSDTSSCEVHIFDREMNPAGSLTDIAPGETLRSARFLDSICYIVTYKNTDPLFSVDLSDPQNPKLLGELKITGFSEYLHFWGDHELLGFGYETDPATSETKGLKLSMFDISDPSNVTEEAKIVLTNLTYAEALSNYKALLINADKNIIGFTAGNTSYSMGKATENYMVFNYSDGSFNNLFNTILNEDVYGYSYDIRGIYIGNFFYLVGKNAITAYDMSNGFAEAGKLS